MKRNLRLPLCPWRRGVTPEQVAGVRSSLATDRWHILLTLLLPSMSSMLWARVESAFSPDSFIYFLFGFSEAHTLFWFFIQPDWVVSDLAKHTLHDFTRWFPSQFSSVLTSTLSFHLRTTASSKALQFTAAQPRNLRLGSTAFPTRPTDTLAVGW